MMVQIVQALPSVWVTQTEFLASAHLATALVALWEVIKHKEDTPFLPFSFLPFLLPYPSVCVSVTLPFK